MVFYHQFGRNHFLFFVSLKMVTHLCSSIFYFSATKSIQVISEEIYLLLALSKHDLVQVWKSMHFYKTQYFLFYNRHRSSVATLPSRKLQLKHWPGQCHTVYTMYWWILLCTGVLQNCFYHVVYVFIIMLYWFRPE